MKIKEEIGSYKNYIIGKKMDFSNKNIYPVYIVKIYYFKDKIQYMHIETAGIIIKEENNYLMKFVNEKYKKDKDKIFKIFDKDH